MHPCVPLLFYNMDYSSPLFLTVTGIITAIYMVGGGYLLFTKHSWFYKNTKPDNKLRKITGYNLCIWGLSYFTAFHVLITSKDASAYWDDFCIITDLWVIPFTVHLLHAVAHSRQRNALLLLIQLIPAIGMLIWFMLTGIHELVYASQAYWVSFAITHVIKYFKEEKEYRESLFNNFSELQNRELTWIHRFLLFFLCYFALYMVDHMLQSMALQYATDILSCFIWLFVLVHVEKQKDDDIEIYYNELSPKQSDFALDPHEIDTIKTRLQMYCKNTELYLQPDLSINKLSRAVGVQAPKIYQYLQQNNQTYFTYINGLRLQYAERLKATSQPLTTEQVALKSGFQSLHSYNHAIKKIKK